jgi:hypothetical protein
MGVIFIIFVLSLHLDSISERNDEYGNARWFLLFDSIETYESYRKSCIDYIFSLLTVTQ